MVEGRTIRVLSLYSLFFIVFTFIFVQIGPFKITAKGKKILNRLQRDDIIVVQEMKEQGKSVNDVIAKGYSTKQAKEAGYTIEEFKKSSFTADDLKNIDFDIEEIEKHYGKQNDKKGDK